MDIITSPELPHPWINYSHRVFLAGGISNCPDWQAEILACKDIYVNDTSSCLIANPRAVDFDMKDPERTEYQIAWEAHMISKSNVVLFWFPKESICPIALLELGRVIEMRNQNVNVALIVGCQPGYQRTVDVTEQLGRCKYPTWPSDNLADLVWVLKEALSLSSDTFFPGYQYNF